jgi:eukaryotic-like serine/threonine-protein kinase
LRQVTLKSKTSSAVSVGARSVLRSLSFGSLVLRKQLWIWPVIAALLLGIIGRWISRSVETAMREHREQELTTVLNAEVAALRVWMTEQAIDVEFIADDEHLLPAVTELLQAVEDKTDPERALIYAPAQNALRERLKPRLSQFGYIGFVVASPAGVIISSDQDAAVGKSLVGYRKEFLDSVLTGKPAVSRPFPSLFLLPNAQGELKANLPTMFAAAAIHGADDKPLAVLGLRISPDKDFTRILHIAESGKTGETYAFDSTGLMLSQSRFDDELKRIGLLVDDPAAQSILNVTLRDPGVNLAAGERTEKSRSDLPLTRLAAEATGGQSGHDVDGYRDYRGVPSIGAWTWLSEYGFGVGTEQDVAESFRPLYVLRRAFWAMFLLLVAAAGAIFVFTVIVARANREARRAALVAQRLGQYTLDKKLGEGGMGMVYLAHHAMLQRPTAVKLLSVDKTNEQTLARFEREVQMTSRLNHPNTIAIYDYGRTPEGVFYYAMEYLEGINLEDLVRRHGPQPEQRVVSILEQACGSLAEAHNMGLIHRDVKPANIMLTERGGISDFVKVLDFGLVKAVDGKRDMSLTAIGSFTGTPLYMSPETIQNSDGVDARTDLYALGAVAYFLLTGTPVFDGTNVMEILQKHVTELPESISRRLRRPCSAQLEMLILKCLAKNPEDRPASATAMAEELAQCATLGGWSRRDAESWWRQYFPRNGASLTKPETQDQRLASTAVISDVKLDTSEHTK